MDADAVDEILSELFPVFEALEAKNAAILQLLKDKNLVTDDDFAPYLQQAENSSNVRWRAVRVRIMSLVSSALRADKPAPAAPAAKQSAQDTPAQDAPAEAEKDPKGVETHQGGAPSTQARSEKKPSADAPNQKNADPKQSPDTESGQKQSAEGSAPEQNVA